MARETPNVWRCEHHYPIVVDSTVPEKRARCLGCGAWGPVRTDTEAAVRSLRDEARYQNEVGSLTSNPPLGGSIHQSAWKGNSANYFGCRGFSEVRAFSRA